jgi:methyl-accepting chemotaxis protein
VKKVSDLIAEIAAASREQSSGIEQVNTAVSQMEHVVQQNASLVEEATAATESMKGQADSLLHMVARFELGGGDAPAAETATMAPPARAARPLPARRPQPPRLTSDFAPLAAATSGATLQRSSGNGEWKEM